LSLPISLLCELLINSSILASSSASLSGWFDKELFMIDDLNYYYYHYLNIVVNLN
jgi:hypothetical protein